VPSPAASPAGRRPLVLLVVAALLAASAWASGSAAGAERHRVATAASMATLNQRIVDIEATPSGDGYWVVAADGGVFAYGDASFFGSAAALPLVAPVVGMASTPTGRGYWLVAADGGIFNYGDSTFWGPPGRMQLNQPVVGMEATPSGDGYWQVAADGGIFNWNFAPFHGSTGAIRLNQPIVGMAATPSDEGYWLVARDGGIFAFGDAPFLGSTGAIRLNQPIVGMAATPTGDGYWLVARDGGIFAFGDAPFLGAASTAVSSAEVVAMTATSATGYLVATADGRVIPFGDAVFHGSPAQPETASAPRLVQRQDVTGGDITIAADGDRYTLDGSPDGSTLSRRAPDGTPRWSRVVVGTAINTSTVALALAPDGSITVGGSTTTPVPGAPEELVALGPDAFIARFEPDGDRLWAHHLGSTQTDVALGVAISPDGSATVVGQADARLAGSSSFTNTESAFVARYDADGTRRWVRQFGGPDVLQSRATAVAAGPSGEVYVTGVGATPDGGPVPGSSRAFVARWEADGTRTSMTVPTTAQLGGVAVPLAIAVRDGIVWIGGEVSVSAEAFEDPFVAALRPDGTLLWVRVVGSAPYAHEAVTGLAPDEEGGIHVVGSFGGDLAGEPSRGPIHPLIAGDAFAARYDVDGNRLWAHLVATTGRDVATAVATDRHGDLVISGTTDGDLTAPDAPPTGTVRGFLFEPGW
jgi:hypothetical protein